MSYTCPCCGWDGLDHKPYERWPDRLPVDAAPLRGLFRGRVNAGVRSAANHDCG